MFNQLANEAKEIQQAKNKVDPLFITSDDGSILKLITNIRTMIGVEPQLKTLAYNEFTQQITLNKEPIDDYVLDILRAHFDEKYHLKFSKDDIFTAVNAYARERPYNPVKKMIESKKWDNIPRVETLFIDYLGVADNIYTRSVTRKWLTGAVARVYEPGIKFEMVPILQGKQGTGKSTIAQKLGGEYFTDSLMGMGKNKDDYQQLIGTWIIELAELSSMNKTDIETMKGFISGRVDKIRLPYARIPTSSKRTSVFIGTTNASEYLGDLTGNRRFFPLPIDTEKATKDIFSLTDETVQQIWAEAYIYYCAGEELYITDENEIQLAEEARAITTEKSLAVSEIEDYLEMTVNSEWNTKSLYDKRSYFLHYQNTGKTDGNSLIQKTTVEEILKVVLDLNAGDRNIAGETKKVRMFLDNLEGWKKKQVWINGKNARGYERIT